MNIPKLVLQSEVIVPQRIEDVWAFLSNPLNSPLWDKSVASIEATGDVPPGVGWTGTTIAPSGNRQQFTVTEWDPPRAFAFDLLESRMFSRATLEFRLSEAVTGVRIVHKISLTLRNPLLYPVLRLTSRKALAADLGSLAEAIARANRR
jgi:uncharacterized protein YndB with AHSA1/START domain